VIVLPTKGAYSFVGILYAGSLILIPPAREQLGMQIFLQTDPILSKRFNNFFVMVQSNWLLAYLSMKQR
jgi:hypothetical protein